MNVSLMYVIKIFFPSILFHSLKLTSQLYTNKQNIKYYSESWFWGTNLIVFYISFSPRFVHVRIEINVPKIFFNFCFFLLMDEKVDSLSPTFEWLSWNFLTEKKKKNVRSSSSRILSWNENKNHLISSVLLLRCTQYPTNGFRLYYELYFALCSRNIGY